MSPQDVLVHIYNGNNEYGLGQLAEFIKQWISIEAQQP